LDQAACTAAAAYPSTATSASGDNHRFEICKSGRARPATIRRQVGSVELNESLK
jgi:hypothetical protein